MERIERENTSQEIIIELTTVCHFEGVIGDDLGVKEGRGEGKPFERERMNEKAREKKPLKMSQKNIACGGL